MIKFHFIDMGMNFVLRHAQKVIKHSQKDVLFQKYSLVSCNLMYNVKKRVCVTVQYC